MYTRNHDVSVSFPVRKSNIELKLATETNEIYILKATHLIALLPISNENTAYLFDISNILKRGLYHLLCGIKRGAFD